METGKVEGDYILDSSVIIKWFSNEKDTDKSLRLRNSYAKGLSSIACPDLMIYEIANALRYNKFLKESDVKEAIKSILSLGINIVVPNRRVLESAISLAYRFNITFYDAYFVALAKELNFEYITADEELYKKTRTIGFIKLLKNM